MSSRLIAIIISGVALSTVSSVAAYERPASSWSDFDRRAALRCPTSKLKIKTAGDINYLQEGFYSTLSAAESKAFNNAIPRVDDGPRPCADKNGITCPTAWNMVAIKKVGLLPRFVDYACANVGKIP